MIRIDLNQVGIVVIPNYRIFAPNFFYFKIIFALSIFENVVASKVFTFTFFYAMPRQSHVGKIRSPGDKIKYVTVALTVRIWERSCDSSLWFHPSWVINIPSGSATLNISTTIQTPEGGVVLIKFSRSICLVGVDDG